MTTGYVFHRRTWVAACWRERGWLLLAAISWAIAGLSLSARQAEPGPAYLVRALDGRTPAVERRRDLLEVPMLPGSAMKIVALTAALEHGVIDTSTRRVCRRQVTVDGRQVPCAHPDLKRALTPAEALAHSCNDFFVALAPRLSREAFNATRQTLGLPPVAASASLPSALLGLSGPPVAPRALLDALGRVVLGTRTGPAARLRPETRAVVREGLAGAARYGSAAVLGEDGISALAKTGTAPMPGGGTHGLLVAWTPAERPSRAMVVVAPGAAGRDAAAIAADVLGGARSPSEIGVRRSREAAAPAVPEARVETAGAVRGAGLYGPPMPTAPPPDPVRVGLVQANGRVKVERLGLDLYVARVLAGEGQPRAADAAQQALAIAARTFAVANRNRHRRDGYDLCDSTHCQVMRAATAATTRAAEVTAGRILLHDGAPAFVFYSAWCGGRPALASEVWPGARDYGEPAERDDACAEDAGWSTELRARDLERVLRGMGLKGDRLRELRVTAHGPTARVSRLAVEGFRPGDVSAHDLRMAVGRALGWQHLKSTAFAVERTGLGYRFSGRGYGHGVGLCVVGAGHRALAGETADDILRFYYPGLAISAANSERLPTAVPAPGSPTVARPTPSGFRLRLPATDEDNRELLVRLLESTRTGLVDRTGLPAPASIQITVHPSVESFGRATGQPWWTAGSTLGDAIELLPVSMLRQQGQLERTLRHEMAHVIVDPVLQGRPLWVREGAALYFAAEADATPAIQSRTACPTDAELSRPVSVGAQRDAYARAEACFRRAVTRVKDWRKVR